MSKRKHQLLEALAKSSNDSLFPSSFSTMPFSIAGIDKQLMDASLGASKDGKSSEKASSSQTMDEGTGSSQPNFVIPMMQQGSSKKMKFSNLESKSFFEIQEEMEKEHAQEMKEKQEIDKENKAWNEKREQKELSKKKEFRSEPNYVKLNMKRKTFRSRRKPNTSGRRYKNALSKKDFDKLNEGESSAVEGQNEENDAMSEEELDDTKSNTPLNTLNLEHSVEELIESKEKAVELLQKYFHHESFRPGQWEIIQRIMQKKSSLFISGTGSGKSTCYQFPALCMTCDRNEFVVVVSPLISLMEDQQKNLISELPGALMTNHQSSQQRSKILQDIKRGVLKILFISPERLCDSRFLEQAKQLPPIAFACIDEAHCMSEWSHNFRPSYLSVKDVLERDLGVSTILALTGTATKRTESSICDYLNIDEEGVSRQTLARHNLIKTVSMGLPSKFTAVLNLLQSERMKDCKESIIIYTMMRSDAEQLSSHLIMNGVTAVPYHAGLDASRRKAIQTQFVNKEINIIIATVAFGMGINISNVQAVIHFNLPRSVESYIQEIGRAGRDNSNAQCHILLDEDDYLTVRNLCYSNYVDIFTVKKLIQKIFANSKDRDDEEKKQTVVLGVKQLEKHLDLKSEVISTVLTMLHNKGFIKLLSNINHIYTIFFMKSTPVELSKKYSWLKAALNNSKASSKFEIDIAKISAEVAIPFTELEMDIVGLKELGEIKYESKSEAFCMEILKPVTNVVELSGSITDEMKTLEKVNVSKVTAMFKLAREFVILDEESQKSKPKRKSGMEKMIDEYFTCENEDDFLKNEEDIAKVDLKGNDRKSIQADCFILLRKYETIPNAKTLSRILTGLSSPNVTVDFWRSCGMWGRYKHVDFYSLLDIATEVFTHQKVE